MGSLASSIVGPVKGTIMHHFNVQLANNDFGVSYFGKNKSRCLLVGVVTLFHVALILALSLLPSPFSLSISSFVCASEYRFKLPKSIYKVNESSSTRREFF